MRTLKHLVMLSLIVFVAVFLAAPSAFAKKALTENELELISAAGEPTVIRSDSTISYTDSAIISLTFATGVQAGLNALTLNNVVGENQVASGLNIASAPNADNFVQQTNEINQSWGAVQDRFVETSPGAAGGVGCDSGGAIMVGNICKGGDAKAAVHTRVSSYGDVIIRGEDGPVTVTMSPIYSLTFDSDAQAGLVALVVNNVVGMNQVATATNILGGSITFAGNLTINGVGGTNHQIGTGQTNTINQFRGAPIGYATR